MIIEDTQIVLTIILLIIEVAAFAWLIIDMSKSKKKQDKIIELENQILQLEESIMDQEKNIISEIQGLKRLVSNKK